MWFYLDNVENQGYAKENFKYSWTRSPSCTFVEMESIWLKKFNNKDVIVLINGINYEETTSFLNMIDFTCSTLDEGNNLIYFCFFS